MAATNKNPFIYSKSKDGAPDMFLGKVQAGATQAIKKGELCAYNETAGYFAPIDAVADAQYVLAIAAEEQKARGRGELTAIRYIKFYSLSPNDIFEFAIDAARSLAIGDTFTLTASDSQKLTYGAGDFAVAKQVDFSHYPQEDGVTIATKSTAQVVFNPAVTAYGRYKSFQSGTGRLVISTADDLTLKPEQCYNNSLIIVTAAKTVTVPAVASGMDFTVLSSGANAVSVDPNASDKIRLLGALLDDGDKLTNGSAAGDSVRLKAESADGFTAEIIGASTWTDGS